MLEISQIYVIELSSSTEKAGDRNNRRIDSENFQEISDLSMTSKSSLHNINSDFIESDPNDLNLNQEMKINESMVNKGF